MAEPGDALSGVALHVGKTEQLAQHDGDRPRAGTVLRPGEDGGHAAAVECLDGEVFGGHAVDDRPA
jgi:hypothetical protein